MKPFKGAWASRGGFQFYNGVEINVWSVLVLASERFCSWNATKYVHVNAFQGSTLKVTIVNGYLIVY